ncbi:MAG: xanthine dehydrogenase family protein molybdopterin-binding subunit [Candidatus Tectomicrobia bacterium]|nr:xanthine dehydrogenase family protein molybdopterin-binding subunit [Candidatus Tectomicrobia bacterium]
MSSTTSGVIGARLKRKEDPRLLAGGGRYVGDLRLPGMAYGAVVRSRHAHAKILACQVAAAARLPGVLAVYTAPDLEVPRRVIPQPLPHPQLRSCTPPLLAGERVRYVGEPLAFVVAADPYLAQDAAEQVTVEYEPLPAVVDLEAGLAPAAPAIHAEAPGNLAARVTREAGECAAAFARAAAVVEDRFTFTRGTGQSIEGRGGVADYDAASGHLRVWSSTQAPHQLRRFLAMLLELPEHRIHTAAPDVGGAFGPKAPFYPEDFLVPYAAMKLGRPVRWLEDRLEHSMCATHEHTQMHDAALAVDAAGNILALRDHFLADAGAYVPWGMVVSLVTLSSLTSVYRVPSLEVGFSLVYTNKVPTTPVRGAGQPQATFVIERLLDRAAAELGIDPVEMRFRNLVRPDQFPYATGIVHNGVPVTYDSGDYPACLRAALDKVDYAALRRDQEEQRRAGRHLGIGLACFVETSGIGPFEGATVRIDSAGRIALFCGSSSQGQGHVTTLAQVCAQELGVDPESVEVVVGESDAIPFGVGTFASRTAVVAANAAAQAARAVRAKLFSLAAASLEAAAEDLELRDGVICVRGAPDRALRLGELANAVSGGSRGYATLGTPGLEATEYFYPSAATYSSGAQVAVVEVDPATGEVRLRRFLVAEDCGRMINPLIVEGQVIGGVAHGVGSALFEDMQYDRQGQPLTCSLMDYLLPLATDLPAIEIEHLETLSTRNPQGIKGVGESGVVAAPAAIAAAVEDALRPFGVKITRLPLTPERLIRLMRAGSGERV